MELTAENVKGRLAPRWITHFYARVDSTNDMAMALLAEGQTDHVVIADEQVKGKGRLGRTWYTPPGTALIVSVTLGVTEPKWLSRVTMLGALAIAGMIEGLGVAGVGIKWPNDVQVSGKKVSGVLSEAAWNGNQLRGVVLGMGVNVRIDFSGTELADSAISIEPVLGRNVDRLELLGDLMARIDDWYARIGSDALFDAWKSRLNMLGKM
ncbi:MAG: biotin--[acetyl-CoA-carboxylase] ligase, partial [Anaerolineae bacterium]|nr:biotin--[acetyl-CoA-carboxylase] ligase [Anaerolineae bacterium]